MLINDQHEKHPTRNPTKQTPTTAFLRDTPRSTTHLTPTSIIENSDVIAAIASNPKKINEINLPGGNGVRIDTAIYSGYTIPSNYDSMIAKIITLGSNRNEAISKMKRALEELVIDGIDTNRDFLLSIIKNPNFIRGNFDTSFIEKEMLKGETK